VSLPGGTDASRRDESRWTSAASGAASEAPRPSSPEPPSSESSAASSAGGALTAGGAAVANMAPARGGGVRAGRAAWMRRADAAVAKKSKQSDFIVRRTKKYGHSHEELAGARWCR